MVSGLYLIRVKLCSVELGLDIVNQICYNVIKEADKMSVNDLRSGAYNKSQKVSNEIKEEMRTKFKEGAKIAQLSREYHVSWTGVKRIVDADYDQRMREYNKIYCKEYKRENYNNNMQRHRDYKRQLHKEGKI